jgi:hypothetical protein
VVARQKKFFETHYFPASHRADYIKFMISMANFPTPTWIENARAPFPGLGRGAVGAQYEV